MNSRGMNLPPSMQTNLHSIQSILSQTSSLLRALILASIALNALLFLSSFLTLGARYVGFTTVFTSLISCAHAVALAMVLSPHILTNVQSTQNSMTNPINASILQQFDQLLQFTSHQYTNNPLAYGTVMGATAMLVPTLHGVSVYFGGIATCVSHRGYTHHHNMHILMNHNATTSSSYYFDSYGICGASGPVYLVSLFSWLLSWVYLAVGVILYTRRNELLEGGFSGIGGVSYMYDEIGESSESNSARGGSFAGDFPNGGIATTMQV